METTQRLLRLSNTEYAFAAAGWQACLWLWRNHGEEATRIAFWVLNGIVTGQWQSNEPRSDEDVVDGWLSAAQVCLINMNESTIEAVISTSAEVIERARRSGDVVRTARVAAFRLLAVAETYEDVPSMDSVFQLEFAEAARVGDAYTAGIRSLVLGRWDTAAGSRALAGEVGLDVVAQRARDYLDTAVSQLEKQGMDAWVIYATIHKAKALADLRDFDGAQTCIDAAAYGLSRFPVLAAHCYLAVWQIREMLGEATAPESLRNALDAADASGLRTYREMLLKYAASAIGAPPTHTPNAYAQRHFLSRVMWAARQRPHRRPVTQPRRSPRKRCRCVHRMPADPE